jgi:hypothetical protein
MVLGVMNICLFMDRNNKKKQKDKIGLLMRRHICINYLLTHFTEGPLDVSSLVAHRGDVSSRLHLVY